MFKDTEDTDKRVISVDSMNALKVLRSKFACGWKELGFLKKRNAAPQNPLVRWRWFVEYKVKSNQHEFRKCLLKDLKRDRAIEGKKCS